jgi:predicted DNA-binding transcriptional regulator AlpA
MTALSNPFEILSEQIRRLEQRVIDEIKSANSLENKTFEDQIGGIGLAQKITGLARSSIYAKVSKREIPFFKRQGTKRLYFSSASLYQWIKEGKKQTKDEIVNGY